MTSIATPDALQSEAYVSTVALFLLFSTSSKEEKVHFRLPGVWRDLWTELSAVKKEELDAADRMILRELRNIVSERKEQSRNNADDDSQDEGKHKHITQELSTTVRHGILPCDSTIDPSELKTLWSSKVSTSSYQRMLKTRQALPIWNFKDDVLEAVEKHQAIIICGETGCGKSTQVPAFILEHELANGRSCRVYCTEPRRISATSLARRVCEELGEKKGDLGTPKSLVGYAIRLESKTVPQTRLIYATTGIVLRMLERSDDLGDITHLVLDEVHERTIDSDFLLIILRKLMVQRPSLRLILMSATVNAQRFSNYLDGAPILNVPGRTYPVETRYLEDAIELTGYQEQGINEPRQPRETEDSDDVRQDARSTTGRNNNLDGYSKKTRSVLASFDEYQIAYDLVIGLLETISTSKSYSIYSKAVLVFLPGIAEIRRLQAMILGNPQFGTGWLYLRFALHYCQMRSRSMPSLSRQKEQER